MSRDDLNPAQLAELDALDRILAREPVDEEHLELAALVDSVRSGAPAIDPSFRERLDAQIEARLARRRRIGFPRRDLRTVALAGGGLVAAAVAFTIVISGGLLDGARKDIVHAPPSHARSFGSNAKAPVAASGASTAHEPSVAATHAAPAGRLVHRSSQLVLAAPLGSLQHVADQVVAQTERRNGVVASSAVELHGPSSTANFSLRVPVGQLASLIGSLSSLASVRSLEQSSSDLTVGYDRETAQLAARRC